MTTDNGIISVYSFTIHKHILNSNSLPTLPNFKTVPFVTVLQPLLDEWQGGIDINQAPHGYDTNHYSRLLSPSFFSGHPKTTCERRKMSGQTLLLTQLELRNSYYICALCENKDPIWHTPYFWKQCQCFICNS